MKKEKYAYSSLKSRIQAEWKIYVLAFVFILIADSIGQVKIRWDRETYFVPDFLCIDSWCAVRSAGD